MAVFMNERVKQMLETHFNKKKVMNILWFDTTSIKTAANNLKNQEINSNLRVIDSLIGYTFKFTGFANNLHKNQSN